jgi:hypothetical protein
MGRLSLHVVQHIPSVGLSQKKIQEDQIQPRRSQVLFGPNGITYRFNPIPFIRQFFCHEFSNAMLVIHD